MIIMIVMMIIMIMMINMIIMIIIVIMIRLLTCCRPTPARAVSQTGSGAAPREGGGSKAAKVFIQNVC